LHVFGGSLSVIRDGLAFLEELDGWVSFHTLLTTNGLFGGTVDLCHWKFAFQSSGEFFPFRSKMLTVSTPRSIELNKRNIIVFKEIGI
jgi:hypothetical protein